MIFSFFCFFEFLNLTSKLEKWKNDRFSWPFSLFFCTLKYANMIRISNMCFLRFWWKNEKLDWPKCARTVKILDGRVKEFPVQSLGTVTELRRVPARGYSDFHCQIWERSVECSMTRASISTVATEKGDLWTNWR